MEIRATSNKKRIIIVGISLLMLVILVTLVLGTVSDPLQAESKSKTLTIPKIVAPKTSPSANAISSQQSITIKEGSNLSQIFAELGIPAKTTQEIEGLGETILPLSQLKVGSTLKLDLSPQKELLRLEYPVNRYKTLIISRQNDLLSAKINQIAPEPYIEFVAGHIHSSLTSAAKQAGLPNQLLFDLNNIFKWQINFNRDLHPGDQFYVLYQNNYLDDSQANSGYILAAKFLVHNKVYTAVRYTLPDGSYHYYTPEGESLEKNSFMRAPVEYSRISSTFSLHRVHPILNTVRAHKGVDLAAPGGAPIHAAASGVVKFAGQQGGYGRLVTLEHHNGYSTNYGHMKRFAKNMHIGKTIKKGEVIGYVGSSGLATAPHLHYEIRKNEKAIDPLKASPVLGGNSIKKPLKPDFKKRTHTLLSQLALRENADEATISE